MTPALNKLKQFFRKYFMVINYRTLVAVIISIVATTICYRYKMIFDVDLTLISVAVVFPLVFTLGSAFQRREKALEHLGRAKGALSAIKYCFAFADKLTDVEKEKIGMDIQNVKTQLIEYLYKDDLNKDALTKSISSIQVFILSHKDNIGRSLSLKVYRLMRDVIMGIENAIAIKIHRTPKSIRAYCELFIYVFPFFYAPTLINHLGTQASDVEEMINGSILAHLNNPFTLLVYLLNIILSFFLITLYNIQEQIENPFDQDGLDDIQLDNYLLDY